MRSHIFGIINIAQIIITFRNIHCVQRACKYKLTLQIVCVITAFQQYSYRNCFPQQVSQDTNPAIMFFAFCVCM